MSRGIGYFQWTLRCHWKGLICILPNFTVFSVDASKPVVDIRVLALITDFMERRWNIPWSFVHLSCVGFTRAKSSKNGILGSRTSEGLRSDFLRFTIKPKAYTSFSSFWVWSMHSCSERARINQSSRYWWSLIPDCKAISFISLTILVKMRRAVANPKGRLVNW